MKNTFYFKKSLGQNFLKDNHVIHNIVDSSNINKKTLVIEVGPGAGALTKEIVPLSLFTILYEADARLADNLKNLLKDYHNYSLILGDFLKADIKNDISKYSYERLYVIANLPYYITTPIIMKFIDEEIFPDSFVIMVQKEVASRFSATIGSKDYGSLTVLLNYFYDISKLFDVSRNCFVPIPNVDSSVVRMTLKRERTPIKNFSFFKTLVKDSFQYKRKTLKNNLKNYPLDKIEEILSLHKLGLNTRAEKIPLEIFVEIANTLYK